MGGLRRGWGEDDYDGVAQTLTHLHFDKITLYLINSIILAVYSCSHPQMHSICALSPPCSFQIQGLWSRGLTIL